MNSKDPLDEITLFNVKDRQTLSEEEKARQNKILNDRVKEMMKPVIAELERKKSKK